MRKITIIAITLMATFASYCGYQAYHLKSDVACQSCHMGFRLQVDNATMPPDIQKVVAQVDEHLLISGHKIRLDPDSENFRIALLRKF